MGDQIIMDSTGERFIPSERIQNTIQLEHYHRYHAIKTIVKDKIVLDIASGEGYGSYFLSKYAKKVIGVDISKETIKHAKSKYNNQNLEYIHGDVTNIPLEENIFDIVVSFETLEHHDKHEEMLKEVKRVLKDNGALIISTPDKTNYNSTLNEQNEFHIKELETEEFKDLMGRFFDYTKFFFQKITYGSLITNSEKNISSDILNDGDDFEESFKPIYNICIASNSADSYTMSSFFDGFEVHQFQVSKLENEIVEMRKSLTWKIGRTILRPFSFLKK